MMSHNYCFKNWIDCSDVVKQQIIDASRCYLNFQLSPKLIVELNNSVHGCLPQFIFLFRDTHMIGYLFIISDQKEENSYFGNLLARHNADELPVEEARLLIGEGIRICSLYNAKYLLSLFFEDLKSYE